MRHAIAAVLAVLLPTATSTVAPQEVASAPTAPIFAVGKVVRGQGTMVDGKATLNAETKSVAGAKLTLSWTPGLATAPIGQAITPVTVAAAEADSSGSYAIAFEPSEVLLKEMSSNDGWANLRLSITSPAGERLVESLTRAWDGDHWSGRQYEDQSPTTKVSSAFVYDSNGKLLNASPDLVIGCCAYGCQYVLDAEYRYSVRVANFHTSSNATGRWEYGATADSSIDTAFAPALEGWRVDGSAHVGSTLSAKIAGHTDTEYHAWARTDFRFRQGHIQDYFGAPVGTQCSGTVPMAVGDQTIVPVSWAGGIAANHGAGSESLGCSAEPRLSHRGNYPANTFFYKGSSKATRIGFAVGLPLANLGATSGYSSNVDMSWDVKRGNRIYLCGQTGDETGTPGVIYSANR
jgi:hypothetical protein